MVSSVTVASMMKIAYFKLAGDEKVRCFLCFCVCSSRLLSTDTTIILCIFCRLFWYYHSILRFLFLTERNILSIAIFPVSVWHGDAAVILSDINLWKRVKIWTLWRHFRCFRRIFTVHAQKLLSMSFRSKFWHHSIRLPRLPYTAGSFVDLFSLHF